MNKIIKTLIFTLLLFSIVSCKDEATDNNQVFDDKVLIKDIIEKIIVPKVSSFTEQTKILKKLKDNYISKTDINNLNNLKNQWLKTSNSYATIFAFNIGDIKDKFYRLRLNNWPSTNNAIENFINNKEVTKETVLQFGSSAKGIPGIEYLIFSEVSTTVNAKMTSNEKRLNYLSFIIDELYQNALSQEALWNSYGSYLLTNNSNGIKNSFNIIFNGLNNVIHFTAETKLGKPAGFIKTGGVNTEILQAFFSKKSLHLIKTNIESLQEVFFRNDMTSIGNKIEFIRKDQVLNDKLKNKFTKILNVIDTINTPLVNSITNEKDKVKSLFDALVELEILFTADVRSTLSLIITGTDGDGD